MLYRSGKNSVLTKGCEAIATPGPITSRVIDVVFPRRQKLMTGGRSFQVYAAADLTADITT
jgi:hypothetical protein